MPSIQPPVLTRFRRLEARRRRLLVEAAARLAQVSVALALLPFRRVIGLGAAPLKKGSESTEDCVWAIEAAARRVPWRTVCIQKGIALQLMLRRRGIDARLHYGVGKDPDEGDLQAHVWVTLDGEPLLGGGEAARFVPVAVYP